jgi:hypothetical protein
LLVKLMKMKMGLKRISMCAYCLFKSQCELG